MAFNVVGGNDSLKRDMEKAMQECMPKLSHQLSKVIRSYGNESGSAIAFYCAIPPNQQEEGKLIREKDEEIEQMVKIIKTLRIEKEETEQVAEIFETEAKIAKRELVEAIARIMKLTKDNMNLTDKLDALKPH